MLYPKLLLLLLSFTYFSAHSQLKLAGREDVNRFMKSKTFIVEDLKPFSFFNTRLQEAVKKHWHITPYDFMKADLFEKNWHNPHYSFIIFSEVSFKEQKNTVRLDVLNIVLGQKGRGLDDMPDLGSIPLCYADDDEDVFLYKIPALLKTIQYQIKILNEQNINNPQKLIDYHNTHTHEIKHKTLWLIGEDLSEEVNTKEKIEKVYPFPFKIVSIEELEMAINNSNDILFVHKIAPYEEHSKGKCWKFIISAKNGQVYYIDTHQVSSIKDNGLLVKDFTALLK